MSKSIVKNKRVNVFIDASNLWEAQKSKARLLDYEKLSKWLQEIYEPSDFLIFYYTAYPKNGTRKYSLDGRHRFYTYLKKGLGMKVRKKELKRIIQENTVIEKGNMDVEMTIDIMHFIKNYDIALFFSGDSDFLELVSYLRRRGKYVYTYSSKNNVSVEMRTGSNGYTDILEIEEIWGRELTHRSYNEKATLNEKSGSRM